MKVMIVNSKIKHKFKTIMEAIRCLVHDFILYFVTAYMRSAAYMGHQRRRCIEKYTIYGLKKKVKNSLRKTIYNSNCTEKMFKIIPMKNNNESKYVNKHCN